MTGLYYCTSDNRTYEVYEKPCKSEKGKKTNTKEVLHMRCVDCATKSESYPLVDGQLEKLLGGSFKKVYGTRN